MVHAIALLSLAGVAMAETFGLAVPSGQPVDRLDQLVEHQQNPQETWLVLRYLAPQIARAGGTVDYDVALTDMDSLCVSDGLAARSRAAEPIDQIVIILLDRPLARGETDPDSTKFIAAYEPTNGGCDWQ